MAGHVVGAGHAASIGVGIWELGSRRVRHSARRRITMQSENQWVKALSLKLYEALRAGPDGQAFVRVAAHRRLLLYCVRRNGADGVRK